MITIDEFEILKSKHGLHHKAKVTDLPAKILAEHFSVQELSEMVATSYFGSHFEALKLKDQVAYNAVNHGQWDLTLSFLAKRRVCGHLDKNGSCPNPYESNLDWWLSVRPDLRLVESDVCI